MSVFRYIGDPAQGGDGPDVITLRGIRFVKGEPTPVADSLTAAKLDGHSHFERADTVEAVSEPPAPRQRKRRRRGNQG